MSVTTTAAGRDIASGQRAARAPEDSQRAERRDDEAERPMAGYATLIGAYGGLVGVLALKAKKRGMPREIPLRDVLLVGAATYKASRLLTRDKVAAVVRQPFVEKQESATAGEMNSTPGYTGVRRAVGELLTCPFCLGQWIATGLVGGLVIRPREARAVASTLASLAVADFLHYGRTLLDQKVEG